MFNHVFRCCPVLDVVWGKVDNRLRDFDHKAEIFKFPEDTSTVL